VGLILAAASCGSLPKTNYYTLRMVPPPTAQDSKSAAVLGIERLGAPEVLRDDRVVYYESPTQLNYYQYHRWSSDPASMVRESISRRLQQAAAFSDVRLLPARDPVDYLIRGRLLNFEERDSDGSSKGHVALELSLVRVRDRKTLWSGGREVSIAAQGKGVPAVIEALNAASDQVLNELLPAVESQVKQDFQQGAKTSQ
jgi:ABC-type uncharacterized transport system auxiliary subunit